MKTALIPATGRNFGLDVARVVAMTLVVLAHGSWVYATMFAYTIPTWLAYGGVIGVELFFVLSGFLIGTILLRIAGENPSRREWLVFMVRRWMRTLPAYYVWMAVLVVVWPPDTDLWGHLLRYATLSQNLATRLPDEWFSVSWSLTVEEWFYLGASVAILALASRRVPAWVPIAAFLLVPPALRSLAAPDGDWFASVHKVVLYRLDAIAYGLVLAWLGPGSVLTRFWPASLAAGLAMTALGWTSGSTTLLPVATPVQHLLFTPVTSTGLALCIAAALRWARGEGAAARLVRALSGQSYAIYLTHLTIFELVTLGYWQGRWGRGPAMLAGPVLILALSWLSVRYVEQPLLAMRPRQGRGVGQEARPEALPLGAVKRQALWKPYP